MWLGIFKLLLGERFGALEEGRELDFQEPSEVGFEDAELLFTIGHRVLGRKISRVH
jgi:hypothetical protein